MDTYEKKYKEALELARVAAFNGHQSLMEGIFPELAESKDEKTRKRIIALVNAHGQGMYKDDMLTWLEKQGETVWSEETDDDAWLNDIISKVESGCTLNSSEIKWLKSIKDKINIHYWTEEEIEPIISDYLRGAEHYGGMIGRLRCLKPKSLEKQGTPYTKKDVDNAYVEGMAFAKNELEKQGEQEPTETAKWSPQEESCICQLESLVKEQWRHAEKVNNAVDIKKMQELMFFLKTLNPNKKPQRMISAEAKEAMYNKPAWSEEDEKMVANLVDYFKVDDALQYTEKQVVDWLKSLKGRAQPQPKQEWSEEDQNALEDVREAVVHYWGGETQDILLYWLKSIKQKIKGE